MLLSLKSLLKKQKNSPAQSKASLNIKYTNKLKNLIATFGCAGIYYTKLLDDCGYEGKFILQIAISLLATAKEQLLKEEP